MIDCLQSPIPNVNMDPKSLQNTTLAIVMGGGAGTRLFPLTQKRAKPAVPLGGKYRLVDIPISNCFNSGFRQVYVLTPITPLNMRITTFFRIGNLILIGLFLA